MRIWLPISVVAYGIAAYASAQQPVITSFQPDGTITWTNISTNCMAVVEEFSPATSNEWSAIHFEAATALVASAQLATSSSHAWFRVANSNQSSVPPDMVLIPGGSNSGTNPLLPDAFVEPCRYPATYSLTVGSFNMDRYEVTNDEMAQVLQWAYDHDPRLITVTVSTVQNAQGDPQELLDLDNTRCRIIWDGSSFGMRATKGSGYPCVEVTWYGAVSYCNYRSEMEGRTACYNLDDWSCDFSANGYRLPTEEEWEYAGRGGVASRRFPWGGDTISHNQANYYCQWGGSAPAYPYDMATVEGHHPSYNSGGEPYTSPVGAFAANAYGLYDVAGNVWEWCHDWHPCYVDSYRVRRGGGWNSTANYCRVGNRAWLSPDSSTYAVGFRAVRSAGP